MSFWSKLSKGLAIGGAGAATLASFGAASPALAAALGGAGLLGKIGKVGGAIGNVAGAIGKVGQVAGGAAGRLRDERFDEDAARRYRDALALQRAQIGIGQTQTRDQYGMNRAALLDRMMQDRAKLGIDAPMARTKQAAYGDALQNVQDVNIDFQPATGTLSKFGVTGGLRPSMFGANARAAGGELSTQALEALRTKSDIPDLVDVPEASPLAELPELSTPQGSSVLEKVTGGVGLGGSILGALGPILAGIKNRPPVPTVPIPPGVDPTKIYRNVRF